MTISPLFMYPALLLVYAKNGADVRGDTHIYFMRGVGRCRCLRGIYLYCGIYDELRVESISS